MDNNIPHLVNWLCHKVKGMRVEVVQASKDPASGDLVVQLKNVREAHAIAKLNGYTYNGQTLKITQRDREYTAGPPPIPAEFLRPNVVQLIAEFVKSRCTPERRMVDLSGVEKQPLMLQTLGRLTTGSWTAILKAVSEIYPQVETISFADNGLRSLTPLNGLAHYLPGVINLSFAQNAITTNTTFRAALGGLASLRELVLIGNPYREEMLEKQRENIYRKQIADLFPSLQYLDTVPIDRTVTDGIKFGGLPDVTTSTAVKAVERK